MSKFVINLEYELPVQVDDDTKRSLVKWAKGDIDLLAEVYELKRVNGFIGFLPEDDNEHND